MKDIVYIDPTELQNSLKNSENENKLLKGVIEKQNQILEDQENSIDKKDNVINILKSKIQDSNQSRKDKSRQFNQDLITLNQNDKIIKKIANTKQQRHVKEPVEPIFKSILDEFRYNYAKTVVSKTTKEILKLNRDEF